LFVHRGAQIDHEATPGQTAAVVGIEHDAAASGKNDVRAPGQFGNDGLFAGAEPRLAFHREDQGNAGASALLDFVVAIEEFPAQRQCQAATDGGFASAHRANEKNAGKSKRHGR